MNLKCKRTLKVTCSKFCTLDRIPIDKVNLIAARGGNHGDENRERCVFIRLNSPISMQAAGTAACASRQLSRRSTKSGTHLPSSKEKTLPDRTRNNNATAARAAGIASWRCAITARRPDKQPERPN